MWERDVFKLAIFGGQFMQGVNGQFLIDVINEVTDGKKVDHQIFNIDISETKKFILIWVVDIVSEHHKFFIKNYHEGWEPVKLFCSTGSRIIANKAWEKVARI